VPELPEAETIVRDLRARVVGATLKRVDVPREDILGKGVTPRRLNAALKGRRLEGVTRRGKNVVLLFNPSIRVMVNLGMSGRLVVSDAARASDLHHIAARFSLEDGRQILYDDIRRFGCIDLHTATTWKERDAELGVEPPGAHVAQPGSQLAARPAQGGGCRQHLRERSAVSSARASGSPGQQPAPRGNSPPARRSGGGAAAGDRCARNDLRPVPRR
jgi:formamidopyrimidine-DNA glycosylase